MRMRTLGKLWPVSALTLGGAGLGQIWGVTTRKEAAATVREAVDAGINLIDVAPRYGNGEAERVVGDAFGGKLPPGVRISTKHHVGNPSPAEVLARLEHALDESLQRMRLSFVDLYLLHSSLVPGNELGNERRTLGVKNRGELRDCLAAEAAGPLSSSLVAMIDERLRSSEVSSPPH